jgi:O-antigen/teichoic acid export membrane protein
MVLFTSLAPTIAHVSATWPIVVALGFSELICLPLINVASLSFQAHEQLGWSSWVSALSSIGRVSAAVLFMLFSDRHTLDNYAIFHIAGSTCAVALAYMFAVHRLAPSRAIWKWSGADVREGLTFSGLWFTSNATVELDKVLALRFAGAEVTGVYSASYRVATVASLPIAALLLAMQPRMFRAHATGDDTARLIRLALAAIIGYSVVGIALLQIASPLIPRILGESFHHAADASRMLAWMMPFYGVRLLGTSVLTARGRQGARAFTECTGLLVMFVAAAWLEPRWGLQGAVVTVIMTECVLAALSWTLVRRFSVDTTRPAS